MMSKRSVRATFDDDVYPIVPFAILLKNMDVIFENCTTNDQQAFDSSDLASLTRIPSSPPAQTATHSLKIITLTTNRSPEEIFKRLTLKQEHQMLKRAAKKRRRRFAVVAAKWRW